MRAGRLRHRISIISPESTVRGVDGEPIVTHSTILKNIWAEVQTVSARENFKNDMRWSMTDRIFKIRYTTVSIGHDDRIVFNGSTYEIQSVVDTWERQNELEIVGRLTT